MMIAVTHKPSPLLNNCELTFLPSQKIDLDKARIQHNNYCRMLSECGAEVITLDGNVSLPDSAFVEDTAIVLDEIAIVTPMGVSSRQEETELIEKELVKFHLVAKIKPPAKIEGGDVLQIGNNLYVGISSRTNVKGIEALNEIVKLFGYKVFVVKFRGSLHLKTACTALDDETVLINPEWIDSETFKHFKVICVPTDEPFAANILRIGETICIHSEFTKTIESIEKVSYNTKQVDISEFLKAEAGLTCLSLVFNISE
jgi:dimethylargininase